MEIPDSKQSKLDITIQLLLQLAERLEKAVAYRFACYDNGRNADALNNYFHIIDTVYIDLYPKLKDKEDNEIQQLYKKIPSMDIPILVTKRIQKNGNMVKAIDRQKFDILFNHVRQLDKTIRYYLDKKNMRIATADDARWSMA